MSIESVPEPTEAMVERRWKIYVCQDPACLGAMMASFEPVCGGHGDYSHEIAPMVLTEVIVAAAPDYRAELEAAARGVIADADADPDGADSHYCWISSNAVSGLRKALSVGAGDSDG